MCSMKSAIFAEVISIFNYQFLLYILKLDSFFSSFLGKGLGYNRLLNTLFHSPGDLFCFVFLFFFHKGNLRHIFYWIITNIVFVFVVVLESVKYK